MALQGSCNKSIIIMIIFVFCIYVYPTWNWYIIKPLRHISSTYVMQGDCFLEWLNASMFIDFRCISFIATFVNSIIMGKAK